MTTVLISDTQPVAVLGLQSLIASHPAFEADGTFASLEELAEAARNGAGGVLVLDRAFGQRATLDFLTALRAVHARFYPVIWGSAMSDAESLRYLQCGARGILHKTAPLVTILACLEAVADGKCWMHEPGLTAGLGGRGNRSALTHREHQVMELVEQGFKNREIASELGIRPGTVKIHLKHIFEKTGVHGRYGLALNGLKEKGVAPAAG